MDPATTAATIATVTEPSFLQGVATFIYDGGIFMWGVLGIFAWGAAVTLERTKAFYTYDVDGESLMNYIKKHVLLNEVQKAIEICSNTKAVLPSVLRNGLKRANQSKEQIQDALEVGILKVKPKLEVRIDYLGLIANLSTLFGLLGTIHGLIQSFGSVAAVDPAQKAKLLAAGIATAMNCTAVGLVSAITMMAAHAFLTSKSNKIIAEIEEYSTELMDLLGTKRQMKPAPEQREKASA
jgi:biopolymer transport protein ExbB